MASHPVGELYAHRNMSVLTVVPVLIVMTRAGE